MTEKDSHQSADLKASSEEPPRGLAALRAWRLGKPRLGLLDPNAEPSPRTDIGVVSPRSQPHAKPQPRDSQRVRVYRAETPLKGRELRTIEQCEDFCESVVGTLWWLNRFPELGLERIPHLRDGRGARQAFYREDPGHPTITLPRRYRTVNVILHELAHWTMHADHDLPNHGYTFTRVFMDLTAEFCGPAARELLAAAYSEHKVHIGAEAVLGPDGIYRYGNDERLRLGRDRLLVIDHIESESPVSGVIVRSTKKQITLLLQDKQLDDERHLSIPRDSIWRVRGAQ
ncbi:MAG: hypothetical protein JHD40_04775 [Acidimicrobiia bacterium]|nr:hypothetical protein [Acidimicrobiia bacterium]